MSQSRHALRLYFLAFIVPATMLLALTLLAGRAAAAQAQPAPNTATSGADVSVTPVSATAIPARNAPADATETAVALVGTPPPDIACQMFPADNIWNRAVAGLPVDPRSDAYIATIGATTVLHPGFGSRLWQGETLGFFYALVPGNQPRVPVRFTSYAAESDPGPYPVPPDGRVQGGPQSSGDRHVLTLDGANCVLYEMFGALPQDDGSWQAKQGTRWDLRADALRPAGWTSADAAGFAILPGLVRYDEVARGAIAHAIRFTAESNAISRGYIWPARHSDGLADSPAALPMGVRLRLKSSFDLSGFTPRLQIIFRALQQYGMILADTGGALDISGTTDPRWNDDELHVLEAVTASDFEVVDQAALMRDPNSGATWPWPLRGSAFGDVQAADYFYAPVRYLYVQGAISGYADGSFRPFASTTRAQMVKIIVLAAALPLHVPAAATFSDVVAGSVFFPYIETAAAGRLVSGYDCGTGCLEFRPGAPVTRGQLSKIVVAALGWPLITAPQAHFADVPPTNPFYNYVETALAHGIIAGYADGQFQPGASAVRAQISKIVYLAVSAPREAGKDAGK